MSKKIVITILIFIFTISGALITRRFLTGPKNNITANCQKSNTSRIDLIVCHGVIAVSDGWDIDYLSMSDSLHNYEVARIYDLNQYQYTDEKIYVINQKTIEGQVSDGVKTKYYQELFQNGKMVTNYYDNMADIPKFFVIQYKTGDVRVYKEITDVPAVEQEYFNKIITKSSEPAF